MQKEDILKDKYGNDPGMTVPEGYFEQLQLTIMTNLPAYPVAPRRVELSKWQRVKPYIYLAAMFAGIWMMMKVFHSMTSSDALNLDNPPAAIVQALESDDIDLTPLYSSTTTSDIDLEEELSGHYESIDDFEADFGYELSPEYASIVIPENAQPSTHV